MCENRTSRSAYNAMFDAGVDDLPRPQGYTPPKPKEKKMATLKDKPVITDAAYKLAKILNEYAFHKSGTNAFNSVDIEDLIRKEWFELSTYAHAVHDEQEANRREQAKADGYRNLAADPDQTV